MIIQLEKPTLRRKDMDAVLQTMADEKIGPGELTQQFITLLKNYMGDVDFVFALRDRYHALSYALTAVGVGKGSVIGVSALSPKFYVDVANTLGATLQIFDVDPETGVLSYEEISKYDTNILTALLLYEPYGNIPSDSAWNSLGLPIVEDITESFASVYNLRKAGSVGNIVVCSFEESCIVSTAGGSAILTDDAEIGASLETLLEYSYPYLALPSMNAALGVVQLSQLDKNLKKRRSILDTYRHALMKTRHTQFGIQDIDFEINGYGFVAILDSKPSIAQQFALRYEVATEMAFPQTVISDSLEAFDRFPYAIPCATRGVRFPLYPFLGNQQIIQIEKVISHLP